MTRKRAKSASLEWSAPRPTPEAGHLATAYPGWMLAFTPILVILGMPARLLGKMHRGDCYERPKEKAW